MREQFANTPNIVEEYKFLVDNFYKGDSDASFDHIKNMIQFMANVRLNPENMRSKTANRTPGEARVGVPKYFSAVHFLESYVYLNMHKYPSFYAYLHGGPCRQETLIVKRLSERFRGNRASMAKSITSFDSYAGLVNYTHQGQTLHALANVVIHMLLTCLLLIKDKFEIVFYPEITRESVRRFLIDETFPKIQRFDKATDKCIELCVEIAAFAEEAFFDHDAATLEALEKLINNVMSIGEATLRRRIHVVVNRSVIDPA
jgi:hypothetical protein